MDQVTAAQAAALTGFSERTIRRKIAAGELPARRLAPNRFAIAVSDLPLRWDDKDLARRLDALERRVHLLEDGQQTLLRRLGVAPPDELPATAGQTDADISTLHELLLQLARETERLGPLLTGPDSEADGPSRPGGRRTRGSLRPVRPDDVGHAGS